MVFAPYCPKSSLKPLFEPAIWISVQFWVPVPNLSFIGQEKKRYEKTSFLIELVAKLENWS